MERNEKGDRKMDLEGFLYSRNGPFIALCGTLGLGFGITMITRTIEKGMEQGYDMNTGSPNSGSVSFRRSTIEKPRRDESESNSFSSEPDRKSGTDPTDNE